MIDSRDRVAKVLRGELPDRVPFFPTIFTDHACIASGLRFEDAIIDPAIGSKCMLKSALHYRADAVRFMMGPGSEWFQGKSVREEGDKLIQFDRRTGKAEGFFDINGGGWFIPYAPPPAIVSVLEAESLPFLTARKYLDGGYFEYVKESVQVAHSHGLFTVGMAGGQTIGFMADRLGGAEAALLCFYDNPEMAKTLIRKAVAASVEKIRAFAECGVDCIYIGDSYASGSVISPAIYVEFCLPAYRDAAAEAHRLGLFCYQHCCGNYNPFLSILPSTGIDLLDGMDPNSGMSVSNTKKIIGDQLSVMGGLSCLTLLQGTPETVYAEAKACIEAGKPGGRFMLGSGCAVPRFTPPENIAAARKAIDDWGIY